MIDFEAALRSLYEQYADRFYAAAYAILQNSEDAEDAVGETFIRLIENRDAFLQVSEEKRAAYAKRILKNISLDIIRKRKTHANSELTDDIAFNGISIEEKAEGKAACNVLLDCIRSMSDALRQALYLRISYDFSTKQIARALGISNTAARKRLSDAQKQIKNCMEVHTDE